ncbi:sulfurtransferase complex subunit TusD [Marinobacter salinisoli]|uniref:Sulfurtransferase complex subunit TusD n=1 Tax=Marinobacter salinisoli TaxID=2769486 RepID=A0ABX7MNK6_9GAMM|nr:sulfurtransferase complex subunit TusD [Marinobacter salinisoli]QSP93789.1 sulfurtransferase complex subunit TusD [Marinobacter salinisoli]
MREQASESFTLVITGAPYSSQAPQTALAFAKAAVAKGHRIDRVFLYGDGVHLASSLATPPSDETHWPNAWASFLDDHQVAGVACVASALRRGLIDEGEQKRYQLASNNLLSPFVIAGLGEWVEGTIKSSKTLYFHSGS